MPTATLQKFNSLSEAIAEKTHNFGSDTFRWMLTNTAPVAGNTVRSDITQIANGNGYTTNGTAITISSSAQSSGLYKWIVADTVFTAAGGSMAAFRYAVCYNDTAAADELVGWLDYGAAITLGDTETFTIDGSAVNGLLQLQ